MLETTDSADIGSHQEIAISRRLVAVVLSFRTAPHIPSDQIRHAMGNFSSASESDIRLKREPEVVEISYMTIVLRSHDFMTRDLAFKKIVAECDPARGVLAGVGPAFPSPNDPQVLMVGVTPVGDKYVKKIKHIVDNLHLVGQPFRAPLEAEMFHHMQMTVPFAIPAVTCVGPTVSTPPAWSNVPPELLEWSGHRRPPLYKLYLVVVRCEEDHNRMQAYQAITAAGERVPRHRVSARDRRYPTKWLINIKAPKGREAATLIQNVVDNMHQEMRITNKASIKLY
ncbi:unnamed protein product [Vitrella brassicaformis CCMP3155]|uniref:Uncharacterized protein n=1 Tax=Vitrella brassicaformis (strain CCMP3155) TaxID=1169540 RepID=A0A0G4FII8_VITBC|nr:unnamed protein product [Vitrella brassicaformis CCMP3155]|eukprot:CEM12927.1 unnamed protein product [Vitrella brassicaformis CCMP3155]